MNNAEATALSVGDLWVSVFSLLLFLDDCSNWVNVGTFIDGF